MPMFLRRYHIVHSAKPQNRNRGNPFRFQRLDRHRLPGRALITGVVMLVIGLGYWLFLSSTFAIERVQVESQIALPAESLAKILTQQFQKTRWKFAPQKNIFAFDAERFGAALSREFALADMYVKKNRPHALIVKVSEKPREIVWSTHGKYFVLDAHGKILGAITDAEAQGKMIIYAKTAAVPANDIPIVAPVILAFIANAFQHADLQALRPQFFIAENEDASEIALKVGEGWRIFFDASQDLGVQMENFKMTLTRAVSAEARQKLDYIDVRFGRRVYYKLR